MAKTFLTFAIAFLLAGLAVAAALRVWPAQSARAMISAFVYVSGLAARQAETKVGTVHYLEGGKGETVVLLHGIFARKEHWIDMTRQLSGDYHVIALDLPGFGDNSVLPEGEYAYAEQAQNLMAVLDTLGVERFHLAANSMGGQIAGLVATQFPDRVASVAFIGSPVGVNSPQESKFEAAMRTEQKTLVVDSQEAFEQRNALLFPEKPYVPAVIESLWAGQEIANAPANRRIWKEVNGSDAAPLQALAARITQPSLIVWCREDRIFDPSGAAVLAEALPDAELVWLDQCGHVPMLDQPAGSGRALRAFLDAQH
ncbi:alpha/beta fold hydrolase [Leisingera aquimarina]|uniref:alpha/beta fold hydrolase n=2 Tax=Leisingera TaxID=191028 RepID=UPI000415A1EB|nr:alpha/beta hydrolase [Leisingera aquimarina]